VIKTIPSLLLPNKLIHSSKKVPDSLHYHSSRFSLGSTLAISLRASQHFHLAVYKVQSTSRLPLSILERIHLRITLEVKQSALRQTRNIFLGRPLTKARHIPPARLALIPWSATRRQRILQVFPSGARYCELRGVGEAADQ